MRPGVGLGWVWLGGRPRALAGAVVGNFDTDMRLICREGLSESFLLTWGELVARGVQKKPDLVEGITLAPAVTGRVLLDAATHLTWSVASELDNMEGIEDAGGVLELIVDGVLVSLEGIQCRDLDTGAKLFAALGQPVLMRGARPSRDQSHSSGPWDDPPREWSTMPVNSRGPPSASVLMMPHMLINPQYPHACETGGVIRSSLQARLDMGPHGIPRGS